MTQSARIAGKVEYREGDGANITIRPGPCTVEMTALDATISWTDGNSRGVAAMPIANFRDYVANKAIQINGVKARPATQKLSCPKYEPGKPPRR